MANSAPIKSDIFRFVTFRSPEHLSFDTKDKRFVIHPDLTQSVINSCPVPTSGSVEPGIFTQFLNQFPQSNSYQEIRLIQPSLYDIASNSFKKRRPISQIVTEGFDQNKLLDTNQVIALFDQLFFQLITKKSKTIRNSISQLLIINHALNNHSDLLALGLEQLTDIKIEIPSAVIDCFKPWLYNNCGGELNGITNLGIADFRRVEQEVCCYVPGEVSHIENVMAKEYKERSTRNYLRTENTIETTRETEIENLHDTATTTRNDMSSEVANVLQQDRSNNYGGSLGVSASIGKADINIDAYADFATSSSSSYSNIEARRYAEEITKRALERIIQKTTEKRTSKIIKEFEEINKHGFDNRNGENHVTGVYRWIDIVYKNRLVNYGKRLMIEFMVPEPAEFYKRMQGYKPKPEDEQETANNNQAPKSLSDLGINSYKDITRSNYTTLAIEYGIVINAPLQEVKTVTQAFSPTPPIRHNGPDWTQQFSINIDPDYTAESASGNYSFRWKALSGEKAHFYYTIANVTGGNSNLRGREQTTNGTINGTINPNLSQSVPVQFTGDKLYTYAVTINITCKLSQEKYEEWQQGAFNLLNAAYQNLLEQFNEDQNNIDDEENPKNENQSNPAINRIIEQRELKRICIEMIMKPYCKVQGRDNITNINACDLYEIPQVNQSNLFAEYANQVKFFEQAIDWKLMSYIFYPYYWGDKCDWASLIQSKNQDPIFEAFLQSGMARVVVPIHPQFTESFAFYLQTGDIWTNNDLVAGDETDLFLSLAQEMQTIDGVIESEWETRVPTTLVIIQGKSAYLQQEGLPCCNELVNNTPINDIVSSENTLQLITPAS
ncbi:MAG: hypothetical protein MUC87_11615 [Bacteroidia bacterium]|jgi:hypothetical protein|nr:hypothetical protein [Bacteroidia bacterium]